MGAHVYDVARSHHDLTIIVRTAVIGPNTKKGKYLN